MTNQPQNSPKELHVIRVSAEHEEELAANGADLHVSVVGESFFTGSAALKKAREVAQLVADLKAAGIDEAGVHVESVHVKAASGLLSRSSSARYHLRIECRKLDSVADALAAVGSQKNAELQSLRWKYDDGPDARDRWLDAATRRAHDKARRVAANLRVHLAGVHSFSEQFLDPEANDLTLAPQSAGLVRRKARLTGDDLGLEVSHLKRVVMRVEAEYLVTGYVA